jgi:serine/threonine protein kinase
MENFKTSTIALVLLGSRFNGKDLRFDLLICSVLHIHGAEYAYTMRVTEKSNVYSYGVILLELLTGRKPVNPSCSDATDLVAWVHSTSSRDEAPEQVLDANISTVSFKARQEMLLVLKIAILCTLVSPSERPEMKEVVNMLQPVQKAS